MPRRGTGCYEFCSPNFKRLGALGAFNEGEGTSIINPANTQAQADALTALLSSFQRNNEQTPLQYQQSIRENSILQGRIHPNPAMNLVNTAVNNLAGDEVSLAQMLGNFNNTPQSNTITALLSSMLPAQPTFFNTSSTALLMLLRQIGEENRQRRAQADAIQNALMTAIGGILGRGVIRTDEEESQRRAISALGQMLGGINNNVAPNHQGIPSPLRAGNLNVQADPIAAILQPARMSETRQLKEDNQARKSNGGDNYDGDHKNETQPLPHWRKRKSPDNDQYDSDDDCRNESRRPHKRL